MGRKAYTEFFIDDLGRRCQNYYGTVVTREYPEDSDGVSAVVCFMGGHNTDATRRRVNDVISTIGWELHQVNWQPMLEWKATGELHDFGVMPVVYSDGRIGRFA